jgi:hypothetical protein
MKQNYPMDNSELNDMDVENSEPDDGDDLNIEKVITAPSTKKDDENSGSGNDTLIADKERPKKGKRKKEKKLNKKYANLKGSLAKWIEKEKGFSELTAKKEELSKDLKELIRRSVDLKEPEKNIALLKKAIKRIKRGKKGNDQAKKIKNKILKLEKKVSRIEKKLA